MQVFAGLQMCWHHLFGAHIISNAINSVSIGDVSDTILIGLEAHNLYCYKKYIGLYFTIINLKCSVNLYDTYPM